MKIISPQKESILNSHYIIDGVKYDISPAELLDECSADKGRMAELPIHPEAAEDIKVAEDIIDESREPSLSSFRYDTGRIEEYAKAVNSALEKPRAFNMICPEHFTKIRVASALMDFIWNDGHFKLGDLCVVPTWRWDTEPVGNMAAFYKSVETLNSYLYDLGVKIKEYDFIGNEEAGHGTPDKTKNAAVGFSDTNIGISETDEINSRNAGNESYLNIQVCISDLVDKEEDSETEGNFLFKSSPYESRHPKLGTGRKCTENIDGDSEKWIVYIPFDPCHFRTGGSLLASVMGDRSGMAPEISDPDYFIDCYEVVRELVEDGMISAGVSVADGGLAAALETFSSGCGLETDFGGISGSYRETNLVNLLFGEVPGVLVEIEDENFDYFDSQLLLQDVAYYPLGHPAPERKGKIFGCSENTSIADILASLIAQPSNCED